MEILPMNNLDDLVEALKKQGQPPHSDLALDMGFSFVFRGDTDHPCVTAFCIGELVQMQNPRLIDVDLSYSLHMLGCDLVEAHKLCFPLKGHPAWNATNLQAARAVEILRDEGIANWDRAIREMPA